MIINKDHEIYLSIGGFTIKVIFLPTERKYEMNRFKSTIFSYYKHFLINKHHLIHYTIKVKNTISHIILHLHDGRNVIEFYKTESDKCAVTYTNISIMQFNTMIQNIVMNLLKTNSGLSFHGSAVQINNQAFIFTGQPGAGKSTIIKLLREKFPVLADDSLYIRKKGKRFFLYQTPIRDKEYWVIKDFNAFSIRAIFFLEKADSFEIQKISDNQIILQTLLEQFWFKDANSINQHLPIFFDFINHFKFFYRLYFRREKRGLVQLLNTLH